MANGVVLSLCVLEMMMMVVEEELLGLGRNAFVSRQKKLVSQSRQPQTQKWTCDERRPFCF
jgi:hypothetical protein